MGHRHLSTTMRYVHHRPRHEAAAALERHFTGAAGELDRLLGAPGDLQIGPSATAQTTILEDPKRPHKTAVRGHFVVICLDLRRTTVSKSAALQGLS